MALPSEHPIDQVSKRMHVTIRRDNQVERRLLQNLGIEYGKLRNEIHVSDLTLCMRQAVYRKVEPRPLSIKQLSYFLDGSRRHETLEKLYCAADPAHILAEAKGTFRNVAYSIDVYHNIPIEFKTTRSKKRSISEHWIRQLAYYMLATESNIGILQVQHLYPEEGGGDTFPAYLIEFTNDEQKQYWLDDFLYRSRLFYLALMKKDPLIAPIYRGEGRWVCNNCNYRSQCDAFEAEVAEINSEAKDPANSEEVDQQGSSIDLGVPP